MLYWGIDPTLGDGCGIWEHLQLQRNEVRTRGQSKIFSFGFVYGVNQKN